MKHFWIFLLMVALCSISKGEDWLPKNYVIYGRSISPDQRFGVLVPNREGFVYDENEEKNYLADLKSHCLIGAISDACFWDPGQHVGLSVDWSKDSKFVILTYDSRFGVHSISALTINAEGTGFHQVRIDETMQHALDQITRAASKNPEEEAEAGTMYAIQDRKIHVCASGTNNPKEYDHVASFYCFFRGTYDLDQEKWISTESRSLTNSEFNDIGTLIGFTPDPNVFYKGLEYRMQFLDSNLNEIYRALKILTSAEKFQQLRISQIAWLKKRDQISDMHAKNQFVLARIQELVSMKLWIP